MREDENENKGREDDAFSKEDVSPVVSEEEEEEEEHEGVILKEERNENHRPDHRAYFVLILVFQPN